MLDRNFVRQNLDLVKAGAKRKGVDAPVDEFLRIDAEFRSVKHEADEAKAEMNRISKSIGMLMGQGKKDEAEAAKAQTGELKGRIGELDARERDLEHRLHEVELKFPNLPHESVPDGVGADDNVPVRLWGDPPTFAEPPKPHWEIAEEHGLIDFERASKISGSGFAVYTGAGAKLHRALIQFMLDHQTLNRGYTEVYPPALVTGESLVGTGNLPKFEDDLYRCGTDDLYLIPTAEVPVTNLLRDEILDREHLPVKYAAFTPCFRREAGAAGRETRGILRTHQFEKVELVQFVEPEESYLALEDLTADAESVLQALGLYYRVLLLCAGDMGEKGCKTYDLEVWSPGTGQWLEVSSCTNFEAFQSRRANVRYRPAPGDKPEFVHILNGSGLAVPRLYAAILETFHLSDSGDIVIPGALAPYMGADVLVRP
ncbi:MAG: serine--tRNA ligase [Fimbriimonadaceae bacterium]|nr:serine--tRNA ligase [Fimbriimonadaceae bacterium]QYK56601.1 MAG: serine--tRNA ligase [Fimbriimonadaceae bacterium]